jgi:protein ImuB
LDDATLTSLHHLGLHTVGQLLAIPRHLIPARFGPMLLLRIDQALGRVAEPLVPLVYHPPVEAAVEFDGIVDSLEPLYLSFKDLIGRVAGQLVRRGLGARRMVVTFHRPYAAAIEKTIDLSGPSRNVNVLFNLIRCAMETIGDVRPARGKRPARFRLRNGVETAQASPARTLDETDFVPRGFTGLRLAVPIFERLSEEQILLLEQEEHRGRLELDRLVERLHIRLGREALVAVQPVESHVPERAYRVGKEEEKGSGFRVQGSVKKKKKSARGLWRSEESAVICAEASRRPLHLLSSPVSVRVMVRPSHDRDGAPVSFTHEGEVHRIVHAVGPERIGGAWWMGHDKTRDYFDVEDESGRRWWLFRVLQTSKWYLHGRFE